MNGPSRHPRDGEWQLARGVLAVLGAVLFIVAGAKMTGIHSEASVFGSGRSTAEVFYQGMGIVSYGLGVVCLLLGLPQHLTRPEADHQQQILTAAESVARTQSRCPECNKPVNPQNLAGHLSIAHGLSDDDARALAGPTG